MIDLSFLTEEEQETIMKVLQRDAALKRVEEERVREVRKSSLKNTKKSRVLASRVQGHLPEKIKDDQQLKNMSGEWFYEAKAKRHRDRIHGADIIRASMRKKKLQVAAEQSKDRANEAKASWVNNVNKDAFLPPELTGAVDEPEDVAPASPSSSMVNPASTVMDTSQENTRKSAVSLAKQRKNPFNSSKLPEDHLSQQTKSELSQNGKAGFSQTSKEGELSESKENSSIPDTSSQNLEKPKQTFPGSENGSPVKAPIPKARKILPKSHELKQEDNQSFPRQRTDSLSTRGVPRGILKRNSSSSSTDSETVRFHQNLEPKSKIVFPGLTIHERISEKEHSLEDDFSNSLEPLKHVRFSSVKDELPQSPGLSHGREVGEFSVLESDKLRNGTEDNVDIDEFWNDPKPSQYRKPLPLHQSASSPSASKNGTQRPMTSGSFPMNGHHSPLEVLTPRPESVENASTTNEHKAKPLELLRLESELSKNPADGLSCVEPEPSQVPDHSSRDCQQGKPPLLKALKARTSSHSGPFATEIRKTTDDSISKVLDWFNRSSHSEDNKSPLQHPQRMELKEETHSESPVATALVRDDTILKENGSKALLPTKVKLMPMESDSMFQGKGNTLPSRTCQNNNVNIKPKSIDLSQQGKEGPAIFQPCEIYGPNQGSKTMDSSQVSKNRGEGNRVLTPISYYSYRALKGPDAEDQVPCNIKDVGSLDEEEPKLHVYEKNRGNSEVNFDSSILVKKTSLKENMRAERESKGGDPYVLKASLEPENIESLHGATKNKSWKKPEVQLQEAGEVHKNQVQREKYKRVSERISFWEGEKAAAKLTHKEPTLSCSQGQPLAKAYQPVKSMDSLSTGQCEYNQVTSKQVVLDENGHTAHLSSFYSPNKPKETRPQISGPSKNYPSVDQSGEVSPFQNKINEPIKRLPVAESWHYEKDITLLAGQHPSNIGSGTHTPLEKDKSLISESNPNFKVKSLKERMVESNTEQVYNHSQFENLRKFWDLGANPNSQENVEKNTNTISQKYLVPFNSQKHKEFSDIKSSGKNTHEIGILRGKKKILVRGKIEKSNSKCTRQVLSDETTFPMGPSRKSSHHLPGNESSKENVEKSTKWFVTPVFEEEKDYSDQEIQESIVKTSVLSKDYKDTFNDSLQKLLSEASSLAMPPLGGKVHGKQMSEPDISGNKRWPQNTDFAETEEDDKGHKETINEHVDKTVAPLKVKPNTLTAGLDKLLKEASGTSPCPLPIVLEPVTTRINSEPEEGRVYEKGIEWSRSTSAYQKEIIAPFPKGNETLVNTVLPQKTESGECQLSTGDLFQVAAECSHLSGQPSHLYRKDSFGDVANSPQEMPSSRDAHLAPQDKALPLRREISETAEKVILPPKTASNDVNAVLQKILREACYPVGREVVPGEVQAEFPEGVQAAGSPQNSTPWATMDITMPDRNDFYSFNVVPDKTHNVGSYLAARVPPSEQTCCSCGSTVSQPGKELPQEVAEIVRETVIQPKSEFLEFSAGLEKLLKEVIETPSSKYESDPGTLSPSKLTGRAEVSRQAASEFHPEEIKEIVKKSEAPLITESAFDISFEKLFRETSEAPSYQLQVSVKEEKPEKEPSQSEQASFLRTVPHFDWTASEASEMKLMSNVFKSQVNQCDEVLGGDEAVTDLSVDLRGSESGVEIPGTLQFYVEHKIGITETIYPAEDRDSESEVAGVQEGASQEPGLEEAPKAISMSRNRQPIPLLTNTENATETIYVKLILASPCKRIEKKEEKDFSDSDFSGGDMSSNAESWRKTSSSEEERSPVLKTLERRAARKMPSKSLEDISSDSPNQAKVDNLPEELVRSAEDVSTVPSQPDNPFSHPDKLKRMSKSVPAFLQDESDGRETDTASEGSYQLSRHKKSPSSLTNLSSSSSMTPLSSVSGSVMSIYSGDFGNLEVKGNIQFAIDYVDSLKELHVFVAQCKDLAAADVKKQRSDPYVKTYLLPDKGKMGKKKTLVVKKTLNPVYNEILRYKIEKQILKTQKLNLSVWHRDTFKRNSFLGEVELDLETWDWDNKQNKQLKWYPLKRKTAPVALEAENRGEMKLALQYVPEPIPGKKLPTTGEVHIWVKECLDLPQLRGSHLNSFVKCIILPDTSRKSRQKTRAVGKTTSPVFNHTMVYDGFRPEDLTEACVELTVWDHYKLTNQFLGGLRIGFGTGKSYGTEVDWMDSTSEEVALWEKMVKSPNTWIEATLPLRMLLIAKISK
ncbi:synaptotagmin-like protein 2 isoform X1 [Zalophus californianus]|uniref:Synaptotagmin-like protein 2 n=2 Tax=Zalophus californianus TaxID=9704 RepID=A0A6J2BZ21_ZALCA|nr:synaptotagmin-like protein 2 isoform X1 [Zalophus californianus]XP_027435550.2 synaptotagmin-like protein 2 isoform X1 [Zalophus californianus]XP_027435551.2 synaptotagmin-like protein 2 isoform X1 [Zalophus californianus]XP_027435552.2 synaptotagmin-like protein 2 isoform X1 [Zalophus californianus]